MPLALVILAIVATLVATFILVKFARTQPVMMQSQRYDSSFGWPLWLYLLGEVAFFLMFLAIFSYYTTEGVIATTRSDYSMWKVVADGIPLLASVLFTGASIFAFVSSRQPYTVALVILFMWLSRPGVTLYQSLINDRWPDASTLVFMLGWVVLWTVYFALSPRVALLFGTPRGARLMQEEKSDQ